MRQLCVHVRQVVQPTAVTTVVCQPLPARRQLWLRGSQDDELVGCTCRVQVGTTGQVKLVKCYGTAISTCRPRRRPKLRGLEGDAGQQIHGKPPWFAQGYVDSRDVKLWLVCGCVLESALV